MSESPLPTFTVKSPNKQKSRNSKRSYQPPNKINHKPGMHLPTHSRLSHYEDAVHILAFQESLLRWGNATQNRHTTPRGLHSLLRGRCAFFFKKKKSILFLFYFSDLSQYGLILVLSYFQVREKPEYERFITEKMPPFQ